MMWRRPKRSPLVELLGSCSLFSFFLGTPHSWLWLVPAVLFAAYALWCWRAQQPEPNPYLCACGYNNVDTKALRCPECGKAITHAKRKSSETSL